MDDQKYLVIGTAIPEAVIMPTHEKRRTAAGGIAGQTASALAASGNHVTLHATVGRDANGNRLREIMSALGVHLVENPGNGGWAEISVAANGAITKFRGSWPRTPRLTPRALQDLKEADFLILSTERDHSTVNEYLRQAATYDKPVALVVSTAGTAHRIFDTAKYPKRLISMNQQEMQKLSHRSGERSPVNIMHTVNAQAMLVTNGPNGWQLFQQGEEPLASPAPTAPRNTAFVGCGDYAAAGACQAITNGSTGTALADAINDAIRTKIDEWHRN